MAGAVLGASGATFAWQAQHLETLGSARARLVAAGARLRLRGRRSTLCIWSYFCVAGAALCASAATLMCTCDQTRLHALCRHVPKSNHRGVPLGGCGEVWHTHAHTYYIYFFFAMLCLLRLPLRRPTLPSCDLRDVNRHQPLAPHLSVSASARSSAHLPCSVNLQGCRHAVSESPQS